MKPVFTILGQSAAAAAVFAMDADCRVPHVDYGRLREKLLADGQILGRQTMPSSPHRRVAR